MRVVAVFDRPIVAELSITSKPDAKDKGSGAAGPSVSSHDTQGGPPYFLVDQATRRARGLPVYPVDERFLEALERGLPPCAGNALGVDRLVALACGTTSIREVMAFADDEL